jgi:hypothetical protein
MQTREPCHFHANNAYPQLHVHVLELSQQVKLSIFGVIQTTLPTEATRSRRSKTRSI